ncbi:unnamed protein product [Discosporangium mesarthrocarpum]
MAGVRRWSLAKDFGGVLQPAVVGSNVVRLSAAYGASVSSRGGIGVLDEAFVLIPGLRDTVGTPGRSARGDRQIGMTPGTGTTVHTSCQLFQDYEKIMDTWAPPPTTAGRTIKGTGSDLGLGLRLDLSPGHLA